MFRRFCRRVHKFFHRKNKVHPLNPEDTESCSYNAECPVELFFRENPRQVPENVTPIDGQTDMEKAEIPIVVEEIVSEDVQKELEPLQIEDQSLENKMEEVQEAMENPEPPKLQDYLESVPPAGSITPLQEQNIEDTESSDESSDEVIEQSSEISSQKTEDEQEVKEKTECPETAESSAERIIQNSEAKEQVEEKESSDSISKGVLETPSHESIGEKTGHNVLEIVVQEAVETTDTAKPLQPPKRAIPVFSPFRGHDPLQRLKFQETKEVSGKQLEPEDIYPMRGLLATATKKPPGAAKIGIPVFSRFRGSSLGPNPMCQEKQVCPDVPPMRNPGLLQRFKNQNSAEMVPASAIPRITQKPINVGAKTCMGDFQLHKLLGEGNFGKVYLAEQTKTRTMVALKTIPREKVCDALAVRGVMREKEILEMAKRKKHPFLIGLVTYFETQQDMCLAMDYAECGDLSHVMTGSLNIQTSVFYTSCIVLGVQFLHENKIVHRDLKPENIMLDKRGFARITDFGLSKAGIGFGNRMCGRCGTPAYWAPEIFVKTFYNRSVDWWAVGVILYQMVVGEFPFKGESRAELCDSVVNKRLNLPLSLNKETCRILQGLLNKNPVKRLGSTERNAEEIKEMLFFEKMDWKLLMQRKVKPPTN